MTERTVSIARLSRKKMPLAALGASVLLLASCGTGEDSPAAQGDVEPRETATTTVTEGGADGGTDGGEVFAVAELINPEGEARGTAEFAEAGGGTLVTVDATDLAPGFHGLHIHGVGLCEPDSENPNEPGERGAFLSAGGHLAGPDGRLRRAARRSRPGCGCSSRGRWRAGDSPWQCSGAAGPARR